MYAAVGEVDGGGVEGGASYVYARGPVGGGVFAVFAAERFVLPAGAMLRKLGVRVKGTSLELPNGSRIVGLPANDDTVRGYSGATMLLIDEAARVPDAMYAAVKPMLATTSGEMWLMSTPHGKRGFFYKERWIGSGSA